MEEEENEWREEVGGRGRGCAGGPPEGVAEAICVGCDGGRNDRRERGRAEAVEGRNGELHYHHQQGYYPQHYSHEQEQHHPHQSQR